MSTPDREAPRHRLLLATLPLFLLMSAVITVRTARNLNVAGRPDLPGDGLHDFRDVVYYPAVAVLDGRNPYDATTFVSAYPVARSFAPYAPTILLLHLPFGLLPYRVAEWTHFALNTLLVLILAYVCLGACRLQTSTSAVLGLGALILLSRPAHMTLHIGQCAAYLAIATYLALLLADRRPVLAGLALAVACAKPTFGLPLCVLMLARRDHAALAWGAALSATLLGLMVAVLAHAAGGFLPLVASLEDSYARLMQDPSANAGSSIIRLDAVALLGRLAGRALGAAGDGAATLAILSSGAAAVWSLARTRGEDARLRSACVACLTILACMYHQAYDGLLLTLPLVALASGRFGASTSTTAVDTVARLVAQLAMLIPVVNYLATDTMVSALGVSGTTRNIVASTNSAAVLVAFAALVTLAVRARGGDARSAAAATG